MSDEVRYRYGEMNFVEAAVDSATVIENGDLLWQGTDDAKPANRIHREYVLQLTGTWLIGKESQCMQRAFAENFLGVALQGSRSGDTDPVRVATTSVFEFDCPSGTFELGDLMGVGVECIREAVGLHLSVRLVGYKVLNQQVAAVNDSQYAIGRVAKREPTTVGSVLIDIHSHVMGPL